MASDRQLSDVLGEFARTMVTEFKIQAILDRFVERIVDVMPVTAAGVTLISPGVGPHYIAASSDDALEFEKLQTELGEGPCVAAYRTGEAISAPDLEREDRFPGFVARAIEAGLAAVFAFPLTHGEHQLGALDLYRDSPGGLTPESMSAARTLAEVTTAYLINAQGRADLQDASERSRVAALHDGLTGLPNRTLMLERLEHAFLRSRRSGLTSAVLFVDLDRFKDINDTFGHRVGDELLVAVARRLTGVLRPGDTLARVCGDEFVILCEDFARPEHSERIIGRLDEALKRQFVLSGISVDITASVGVAFSGRSADTPEEILDAADSAMYRAKRAGGDSHRVLDPRYENLVDQQMGLERDLSGLLERHELYLDYQPIVTTPDGRISGVEALLRWPHPRRGLVAPSVLVPLAERYGLISAIGQWVLEEAASQRDRWHSQYGVDDIAMSVNVSGMQLLSPGFADAVGALLETARTSPDLLTLELTESVLVRDAERCLMVLTDLKDMGVRLALDDFGTGYSSLSYLLHFPIDVVKIDGAFVAGLGRTRASEAIVAATVQVAHGLGMTVVAEGVETVEQRREVDRLHCDLCQGFFFARPMQGDALGDLVRQRPDGMKQSLPALAPSGVSLPAQR